MSDAIRSRSAPAAAADRSASPAPSGRRRVPRSRTPAPRSRRGPLSARRCQARSRRTESPAARARTDVSRPSVVEPLSSRAKTPSDQPSAMMWCSVTSSHTSDRRAARHGAKERALRQIERLPALGQGVARRIFAFVFARSVGFDSPQRERIGRTDDLERPAVHRREGRSQRLVPIDDRAQAPLESRDIEPSAQPIHARDVVRGAVAARADRETTGAAGQTTAAGVVRRNSTIAPLPAPRGLGFLLETQREPARSALRKWRAAADRCPSAP